MPSVTAARGLIVSHSGVSWRQLLQNRLQNVTHTQLYRLSLAIRVWVLAGETFAKRLQNAPDNGC